MSKYPVKYYPRKEEQLNVISHGLGFLLSVVGSILLLTKSLTYGTSLHVIGFMTFGVSMMILYLASTLYHSAKRKELRMKLNIFDHAAIYVLIAGTYTPFCLLVLPEAIGNILLYVTWGLAVTGITLKLFFTGRYKTASTIGYVLMGWIAVVAVKPMIESFNPQGLLYMALGGLSYTVGAILYSIKKIPYNHAIFHIFVLIGTLCHFISVYFYIL